MTVDELLAELPKHLDPEGARGFDNVVDLVVDEDRHQLVLRGGVLTVLAEGPETADLTVRCHAVDLQAVAAGRAHPVKLFAAGRLKASGDLLLAMRLRKAFRIPKGYG